MTIVMSVTCRATTGTNADADADADADTDVMNIKLL